jgi:hypothetical protein
MRRGVFLVGAGGGVLVSAAGWIPLRVFLPKTVVPDWMPEWSGARSHLRTMGARAVAGYMAASIAEPWSAAR